MKIPAKKIEKANAELVKIRECLDRIDFENNFKSSIKDLKLISSISSKLVDYFAFLNNVLFYNSDVKAELDDFEKEVNIFLKEISLSDNQDHGEIDDIKNYEFYKTLQNHLIKGVEENKLILPSDWKKILNDNGDEWFHIDDLPF